jgi:hypothetical protein
MWRILCFSAGAGFGTFYYDITHHPWSPNSPFSTEYLFGNSLVNGGLFLLVLLFFRLSVLRLLVTEFIQADRWRCYLGPDELRQPYMDDFNRDAY